MKHLGNLSIAIAVTFTVFLLVVQSTTAVDYEQFIFRPPAQKQSFLKTYFLKHFQENLFDGSYAIVIAVGAYDNLPRLESVRSDADKMTQFLLNTADYDEVVVLKDADASFDAIRYFMEVYFPTKMMEGRYRFLFYFSGHGTQRQGISGPIGYLQLKQAGRQPSLHAINMNHIENWAEQFFHARHVLFLIDACFSGLAGIEDKSYETGLDPIDLAQENGRFMITAGGADETSIASLKKWKGSLFTDVVLHGMRGNADTNRDGVITIHELFSYTQAAVSNEAKKARHSQHPLISNLGSYADKGQYFFVYQDPEPPQIEAIESPDDEEKKNESPIEIVEIPENEAKETKHPQGSPIILRSEPKAVSSEDAQQLFGVVDRKFDWGTGWGPQHYIDNQFERQGEVVVDHATGLMWQQSGSENAMTYADAQEYVEELNRREFAGYADWRLPTIPELMSLLEPEKQSNNLYINPIFDDTQLWCWSADRKTKGEGSSESAWVVDFRVGLVYWGGVQGSGYVRCVRS